MTEQPNRFRNVIVCEDIRDEVGNKKSLMGVLSGDILVPSFPATIKIAVFMEYYPGADDGGQLSAEFRILQDDIEIAKGKMEAKSIRPEHPATFVFPTGLVVFEKEATFRLYASVNKRPEQEIVSKRVGKLPISP